jgi:diacylglycerol kinase (ATP)
MFKHIEIIINPASGNDEPILNTLNDALQNYDGKYHFSITQPDFSATRYAREALERGVGLVAVYGGDGTLYEVGQVLMEGDVPMGILPGGTGNALSIELGIPQKLDQAIRLLLGSDATILHMDTGRVNNHPFVLNTGTGMYGELIGNSDRAMKDRYGWLAYVLSGLRTLVQPQQAEYRVTVDGETTVQQAITCMVANTSTLGIFDYSLSKKTTVDDGLLDVFLIRDTAQTILEAIGTVTNFQPLAENLVHLQGREIRIEANPQASFFVDGEGHSVTQSPADIQVLPHSLPVVVPKG